MNKRTLTSAIIGFIVIVSFITYMVLRESNVDIKTTIERSLLKQYRENTEITIFETFNVTNQHQIIGYILNDTSRKCGFAVIENLNGKYKLKEIKSHEYLVKRADSIYVQYTFIESAFYRIILSTNDELSKISIITEEGVKEYIDVKSNPSLTIYECSGMNDEYYFLNKFDEIIN